MKGDLSRETFDRSLHHSAVRLQQGRIVTDADWNEQAALTRYRAERQAQDIIGACGVPLDAAGYALVAETNALAVHAVNANVAWITAEDGVLLATTNGGADWGLADAHTSANLRALQQVGGVGWAVGDGGVIRKTSNQGATWTSQDAGTLAGLRGVSVFDADHAWAVGDGGIVVGTSDGGANWLLAQTDAARLHAVHFVDALNGVAVGQAGRVVSTSDGGQSWVNALSGTTAHLRALSGFGTTLLWAAGQGGVVVRSTDFGATWLPCNTSSSASLHGIAFRDDLEGWAVGEDGVVLHSTDGGANWLLEAVGTAQTLRGIAIFGSDAPWVVGDATTALRLASGSPEVDAVVLPSVNLSIEPGRCYVGGSLCELEVRASYAHQPDGGAGVRLAPGAYLVYLDAWQRHLSALEAPLIREVALGGPDTATRARTIAQVRALPLPATSPFDSNCDSQIDAWDALVNAPRPLLAARSEPQLAAANLCEIAATAGYRRLENQLYRVEIHDGGSTPTFKWSRENGSVAYAVVSVSVDTTLAQTTVRVAARGRDSNLDLAVHDRVELIDDVADLTQRAGVFFEYLNDGDDELELVLAGVPTGSLGQDASLHPVLRRWDHQPTVASSNVLPLVEDTWVELEDGVQVRFVPGGVYRPGDHWQIPARTITADVEWPRDDDGDPVARPPAGIADAYCRLGIVEVDANGGVTAASDCRNIFPPLTQLEQLLYVSGDGQDALPNAALPQPLAVRVARGSVPVAGVGIRFEIESGGGRIDGATTVSEATTDADGLAEAQWTLGPSSAAPGRFQRVRASLLDADGQALPGQIAVFCATATVPATGGGSVVRGCDITIGKNGQFPELDSELLNKLLKEAGGNVCLCFMPGTHDLAGLEANGGQLARLSIHGCGHASVVKLARPVTLAGFAALELRDLVIQAENEIGISLQKNGDLRLAAIDFDRPVASTNIAKTPCLIVAGADRFAMTGCAITTAASAIAAVVADVARDAQIAHNRFVGIVSFYGNPAATSQQLIDDLRRKLAAGGGRLPGATDKPPSQLAFHDNHLSQLLVSQAALDQVFGGAAINLFDTAAFTNNAIDQPFNLFISRLLTFGSSSFLAQVASGQSIYGLLLAGTATAFGNVAAVQKVPLFIGGANFPVNQVGNAMDVEVFPF